MKLNREIWKFSAGETSYDEEPPFWEEFQKNNIIAFGDYGEGDLNNYDKLEELERIIRELKGTKHSFPSATFYFQFRDELEIGDIVIVYSRKKIYGIGYITSDYYYKKDRISKKRYPKGLPNRRNVKWINTESIEDDRLSILKDPQLTFYKLNEVQKEVIFKCLEKTLY